MLKIANYVIDGIAGLTEQESGVTLELLSGKVCTIPKRDLKMEGLIDWARFCSAFNTPIALRIINDKVVDAAEYTYRPVSSISPQDDNTVKVWLLGRPGPYRFSRTEANSQYSLLVRSLNTHFKLLFLISGAQIDVVVELSPSEIENLTMVGGIL